MDREYRASNERRVDAIEEHFDHIADAYYEIVDKVWYEYGYCHQREIAFLQKALREKPQLAMDAGCGPGRHTALLASVAARVLAVDVSRRMLRLTRESIKGKLPAAVEFVQADIRRLPFKAELVDCIVNFEVLEHLPGGTSDLRLALQEFRRVLAEGGTLIVEVPLKRHRLVAVVTPPSLKEILPEERRQYYEKFKLPVADAYPDATVEKMLLRTGFTWKLKEFVRVLPSGLVERFPQIGKLDRILERVPFVRRFAREAIWLATAT